MLSQELSPEAVAAFVLVHAHDPVSLLVVTVVATVRSTAKHPHQRHPTPVTKKREQRWEL